jgi:hypothetical protein
MIATPRSVFDIYERLAPPSQLTDEQVVVWSQIVGGHPGDWFEAGSVPLLTQLCRHVVLSNKVADLIDHTENKTALMELLKQQRDETDCIRKLSTSLRITPQSVTHQRGNKKQITATRSPHARFANTG